MELGLGRVISACCNGSVIVPGGFTPRTVTGDWVCAECGQKYILSDCCSAPVNWTGGFYACNKCEERCGLVLADGTPYGPRS